MKRIPKCVVACLIFYLVMMGSILTAQAVEHSQRHSQHHSGTHSTLLCTWFCAAGHTLETNRVLMDKPIESLLKIDHWHPVTPQEIFVVLQVSRAPPSCF